MTLTYASKKEPKERERRKETEGKREGRELFPIFDIIYVKQ